MIYTFVQQCLKDAVSKTVKIRQSKLCPQATKITNLQSWVFMLSDDKKLPLQKVRVGLPGVGKYDPQKFAAIIVRGNFGVNRTTCMVYQTGQLVVIGALSHGHALYVSHMYRLLILATGITDTPHFRSFIIGNFVAATDIGTRIDLKSFRDNHQKNAVYDPETFPGCMYWVWVKPQSKCKCVKKKQDKRSCKCNVLSTIFDSGKINFTGSESIENINMTKHKVFKELERYKTKEVAIPKQQRFRARQQNIQSVSSEHSTYIHTKKRQKTTNKTFQEWLELIPNTVWNKMEQKHTNQFVNACVTKNIDMAAHLLKVSVNCRNDAINYITQNCKTDPYLNKVANILL
ncbi:hypothetical protein OAB94_02175 [Flavobacteriaceae bacterium]|nr:hypothetical protein [Flavobacteriaceae bacterium]